MVIFSFHIKCFLSIIDSRRWHKRTNECTFCSFPFFYRLA